MEARRKSVESDLVIDVFFTNIISGKDGVVPVIGANKHWYINGEDSGVVAEGKDGKTPSINSAGNWSIDGKDLGVAANGIPSGVIVMWSGSISKIPQGWKLCDGSGVLDNGDSVPDLRGRFIVGYDSRYADYDAMKKTGGAKTVTLTKDQMPRHQHYVREKVKHAVGSGSKNDDYSVVDYIDAGEQKYTSYSGSGQAHENRPPYYVLAYIIKL